MRHAVRCLLIAVALTSGSAGAVAAGPSAPDALALVQAMRQAGDSTGFELRMAFTSTRAGAAGAPVVRLSVVGQFDGERQRIRVRAIAPPALRDEVIVAERGSDGRIRARGWRPDGVATAVDPFASAFGTPLVIWDLFRPWWQWPAQARVPASAGTDCVPLRSQPAAADGPIREVLSCVVPALALATSTQLFDGAHRCVRRIVVTRWFHAANGLGAARKMLITGDDGDTTEVEVYGGDEHYEILPDTFAAPTGP